MKRTYLLLLIIFNLLLCGCTIIYNTENNPNQEEDDDITSQNPPTTDSQIDPQAFFYPSTLNSNDEKIVNYSYIDSNLSSNYKIYSAYYSEQYDTIYIAYDYQNESKQTLKAKDLKEIEQHAINYFTSDSNRSEDTNYLKAVRIYPDRLASSCRKGADDATANSINGCADYGGKEAIIDLNNISSLDDFYNPKTIDGYYYEPMRDTFAHEYGHISTFYHMVYKNDENYEDYLKLRLDSYYNTIFPTGLPDNYSSGSSYIIQPEEILADDFVELFYDTSSKKANDTYNYILNYNDLRNSLNGYIFIQKLSSNQDLFNTVKEYYSKFIDYTNKVTYETPIVISKSNNEINYYESYSHIGNLSDVKTITSLIDVNLIAVGETTINDTKYYRVILSNTFSCPIIGVAPRSCDKKDTGEKFGYVEASNYSINTSLNVYKIDQNNGSPLNKNSLVPIKNNLDRWYILPYYESSYIINLSNSGTASMYDYLNEDLSSTQKYEFGLAQFGTLIS